MPDLLYSENPPPRSTLYLNIPLGSESPATPMMAVFLSRHAAPTSTVDLLLYLHGHKADSLQIDDYLTKPQYRFRERLNAAGKAAILVAPTLGPKSQPGILATQGDAYLSDVLDGLKQHGGFEAKPTIDNLVLACHSGGGVAMLALAQTLKGKRLVRSSGHCKTVRLDAYFAPPASARPPANTSSIKPAPRMAASTV